MTYLDFRDAIRKTLGRHRAGLTWPELRRTARLPYDRPCPEWTARLESEIGLRRNKGEGRSLVWSLGAQPRPSSPAKRSKSRGEHDDPAAVDALVATLPPARQDVVNAIRKAILSAGRNITEGVKWNSASFYRDGWFATVNARDPSAARVILHAGAKSAASADFARTIDDPAGLLKWLGPDRAMVAFATAADVAARRRAFVAVARQWAAGHTGQSAAARPAKPKATPGTPATIDDYIAAQPRGVQAILRAVRDTIRSAAPAAQEAIKYQIPTFVLNGGNLVHFAAHTSHVGLYPGPSGVARFKEELAGYVTAKGSVQFPLARPIPHALIRKIVAFRVKEESAKAARKRR